MNFVILGLLAIAVFLPFFRFGSYNDIFIVSCVIVKATNFVVLDMVAILTFFCSFRFGIIAMHFVTLAVVDMVKIIFVLPTAIATNVF